MIGTTTLFVTAKGIRWITWGRCFVIITPFSSSIRLQLEQNQIKVLFSSITLETSVKQLSFKEKKEKKLCQFDTMPQSINMCSFYFTKIKKGKLHVFNPALMSVCTYRGIIISYR